MIELHCGLCNKVIKDDSGKKIGRTPVCLTCYTDFYEMLGTYNPDITKFTRYTKTERISNGHK